MYYVTLSDKTLGYTLHVIGPFKNNKEATVWAMDNEWWLVDGQRFDVFRLSNPADLERTRADRLRRSRND